MLRKELHEENRLSWNEATKAHNSHKGDQTKFFREGGSTLFSEEKELLGNISGLSLLHLQCNAGQDTLSLAQLGAFVTGIDISDEAITFAKELSHESGIPANFFRADLYDWLEQLAQQGPQFDVVFSSYGAICWLSNLSVWAELIASVLNPDGRLVLMEFHPVALMWDEDFNLKDPYSSAGQPITWKDGIGDYVAESGLGLVPGDYEIGIEDFQNPHPVHEFQWGVGEIVTALLQSGLVLELLQEYPYSNGCKLFHQMRETPERKFSLPEHLPNMPLMYGVVARKN